MKIKKEVRNMFIHFKFRHASEGATEKSGEERNNHGKAFFVVVIENCLTCDMIRIVIFLLPYKRVICIIILQCLSKKVKGTKGIWCIPQCL